MRVAILGCGYVGLELGRQLQPDHEVVGVRRSAAGLRAVEAAGLKPVEGDLTEPATLSAVPDVDAVVFAASSGGRGASAAREIYVQAQQQAIDHFCERDTTPDRYYYTSSTGVYGDHDGDWVDEETPLDPQTKKTKVLAEAEQIALERPGNHGIDGTVVRLGGLYGPDRYRLSRYIEGPVTGGYLNMIHRDDAAGAIGHLLVEDVARDEVVLAVDDEPVDKWEFADWLAEQCGVDAPPKQTTAERLANGDLSDAARRRIETSKRCSNERLRALGYEFEWPTFRDGYRSAIDAYRAGSDA
jgi:nucleoside-diphosphate-sugar epimerase